MGLPPAWGACAPFATYLGNEGHTQERNPLGPKDGLMEITDADRLANDGSELVLADGRRLRLKYGYGACRRIEERFGSVVELVQALCVPSGNRYYEAHVVAIATAQWKSGVTEEDAEAMIDDLDIDQVNDVVMEALLQALPKLVRAAVKATRAEAKKLDSDEAISEAIAQSAKANESTGPATSTSPPLSVVAPMATSGT